jgi:molybdopterin-guanine dinucleotide biosynthesis protein MobB
VGARILGVAGWQGAGKTTLLERVIPALLGEGLAVAVVKHDVHGLVAGPPQKDSERLRRAGADVVAIGPGEGHARWSSTAGGDPAPLLAELERRYDLVLVEGFKRSATPKVWLSRPGEEGQPAEVRGVVATLAWGEERVAGFLALARSRLATAWRDAPRRAGLLVGGAGRRMGRRKESLPWGAGTLLDHVAAGLAAAGAGALTLLGAGAGVAGVPPSTAGRGHERLPAAGRESPPARPAPATVDLLSTPRLPDAPGIAGPLGALLAALRWSPATWTMAACDLPSVSAEAVCWLLEQRAPGRWAVMPRVDGKAQPLLAVYEPQVLPLLEALAAAGSAGPSRLAGASRVFSPEPPEPLRAAWRGVNTPAELAAAMASRGV